MPREEITAKAVCVVRDRGSILVSEVREPGTDEVGYRPLGGHVEFGEYTDETVAREFREELDAEVTNLRRLGIVENHFEYDGEPFHEFVAVYDGTFEDESLYERESIPAYEPELDQSFEAVWKEISAFVGEDASPLFPDGLLGLLRGEVPVGRRRSSGGSSQ